MTFISSTSLEVSLNIDSGQSGAYTFQVTTLNGSSSTVGFTIETDFATVTSISPNSGVQGATIAVTITGTRFTGAVSVNVSLGMTVAGFTVDSDTQISAVLVLSASAGSKFISVSNANGAANSFGFTITTSAISSASTLATSVLAGSTTSGSSNGTGAAASFNSPGGAWTDGLGNLYVSDTSNHTIRKVVLATGVVTTIAGSGSSGSANGTGPAATFNFPEGLWGDGFGNLYVADLGNHLIRKIVIATQVVSTLAGSGSPALTNGTGTGASFNSPHAVWGDAATLYVADKDNHVIRKIVVSTGVVTTFAGTGIAGFSNNATGTLAQFDTVLGIWGDDSALYVTEGGFNNNRIRKVELSGTQTVTTLAGAGPSGSTDASGTSASFNFPHSIWGDGTNLWVVDLFSNTIRKIVISSQAVTTVAGSAGSSGSTNGTGSGARFTSPQTIVGDGLNIYVSGGGNNQIRKLAPPPVPIITSIGPTAANQGATIDVTITGTGFTGTSVDVSGTGVIVPSFTVDSATQITATLVLSGATGARNLTVTTSGGTSNTSTFTINASPLTSESTFEVSGFLGSGSPGFTNGVGVDATFDNPAGVFADATHVYVADTSNSVIRRITIATGRVTTLAGKQVVSGATDGTGSAARFNSPRGLWSDGTNLYVVDTSNSSIRKIVIATGVVTTFAGSTSGSQGSTDDTGTAARFKFPWGIWGDGTNLYVTDRSNHTIRKIVISSQVVTTLAGTAGASGSIDDTGAAAQFNFPLGITGDGTNLFVVSNTNDTIRKIVISSQVVTTLAGTAGSSGSMDETGPAAQFNNPEALWSDGTNLYVADKTNHTIRKVVIGSAVVTTLAGTAGSAGSIDDTGAAARFHTPLGISGDGTDLYVTEGGNNDQVRKVVIATEAVTTPAGKADSSGTTDGTGAAARFDSAEGVWGDGAGNLYVADTSNHTIRKVVLGTRTVTTLAGLAGSSGSMNGTGGAARFDEPSGIWGDGTNLYVTETDNHAIRKIVIATGEVTILAGSTVGSSGSTDGTGTAAFFNQPKGIWGDGTHLYVGSDSNHAIRKIEIATGIVTTFAGSTTVSGSNNATGTAARFFRPNGVWGDGTNLYVAATRNHTIRKVVLSSGVVTTLAGTAGSQDITDGTGSVARFNRPIGLWGDGTNLYVADSSNGTVRKVVISSAVVTTPAGLPDSDSFIDGVGSVALLDFPFGLWGDGTLLYLAESNNSTVRLLVGTPTLTSVTPGTTDGDQTVIFTLTGTGFIPSSLVSLSGLGSEATLTQVDFLNTTTLQATVSLSAIASGTLNFTVDNEKGSSGTVGVTVQIP